MTLLYVIYALIGISIIIFIHEAGHFLAAKRVGVRVERFAVGFDPLVRGRPLRFFTIRWGETEYVLGMIPFGGYVKLAGGEMMLEPDAKPAPDELPGKSVGARALVFVAGSLMNIVSAFFFFMIAFTLGVPFPAAEVGVVEPGTPAWEAGLKPGDKILSLDGTPTEDFIDIKLAVALGSTSKSIDLEVARPGKDGSTENLNLAVTPRWDAARGFNVIGIGPADSRILGKPEPDSPAARAGLRAGDEIVGLELNGNRLPHLPVSLLRFAFRDFVLRRAEPFRLEVARDGKREWIDIIPEKPKDARKRSQIGVAPIPGNIVRKVQVGSDALEVFQPGDRLLAVGGRPFYWVAHLLFANELPADELELKILSRDNQERLTRVGRDAFLEWNLKSEIFWADHSAIVGKVGTEAPLARAGLRPGDIIQMVNGEACYSPADFETLLSKPDLGDLQTALVTVLRDGETVSRQIAARSLRDSEGVTWETMPRIDPTRGGPAEKVGILAGAKVLTLEGKRLYSWGDMVQAVQSIDPDTTIEIGWVSATGEKEKGRISVGLEPVALVGLPIKPFEKTLRVSALESIRVGAKKIVQTAKQIFLTLRSLISRELSAKNLSGPVGITHLLTKVAEQENIATLIYWLALISVNLGIFNLLPFPILDGGHLLFLAIEKIKGSPVSVTVQDWAMRVAFLLIIFLAVFVTFNDLKRLLG